MPFDIGTLGMQAAGGAVGSVLGLALEGHNDRRQLKQQGKLQAQEIAGQKEMGEFNLQQQMKLWEMTNYKRQMEELKKAGLNPGLIYGMSGGGGQTAAAAPGHVSGGNAQGQSGEAIAGGNMGMQLGMMAAQQKLIDAQAENLKADTENKRGVERSEGEARIESIGQGINNAIIQGRIMKLEEQLKQVSVNVAQGTKEEQIMTITHIASKLAAEVTMAEAQNMIDQSTTEAKIKQIQTLAIGAILDNALTKAQTAATGEQTKNLEADRRNIKNRISMWAQENMIELQRMSQGEREIRIKEELKDSHLEMQGVNEIIRGISEVLEGTMKKGYQKVINIHENNRIK